MTPLIVDIKRHSLEDGPGIRSVVFFKGCPLRCDFCHNPETQDPNPEVAFYLRECIFCGQCAAACPKMAIDLKNHTRIKRDLCDHCGQCVAACPGNALRMVGQRFTVAELMNELVKDRAFYAHSGGGVTLSGGECTLFPDYVAMLLHELKRSGFHVALQTSGFFVFEVFTEKILPYVDLIYFDIKFSDSTHHKTHTGVDNAAITENFKRLMQQPAVVVPRIPLIPFVTATPENLKGIAAFLKSLSIDDATLLPYNPLGRDKLRVIGKDTAKHYDIERLSVEDETRLKKIFYAHLTEPSRDTVLSVS